MSSDLVVAQGSASASTSALTSHVRVAVIGAGLSGLAAADAREPLMELTFAASGPKATRPIVERRLATYRRLLGERDVRTALSLGDLGVVLNELGEPAEAERAFRAIDAGTSYRVIPWQMGLVAKLMRLLPNALFDKVVEGRGRKKRRGE